MATPTLVIIPTYNEAQNVGRLLDQILSFKKELDILVVDDSSPDGTGSVVKERKDPKIHLLTRKQKQGLSQAYIAGFLWAIDKKYANIIQMDADFSHDPKDLLRIVNSLSKHDVVVGSRYIKGGRISGWSIDRKFISRAGNLYAQAMLRLPYKELTGGFNGWRRTTLEKLDVSSLKSKGYAFQIELKYRAHKLGVSIKEIPIHFRDRTVGKSKFSGNIVWEAAYKVFQMKNVFA